MPRIRTAPKFGHLASKPATTVPWFSFQREIVDRAVLSLKDAGVPSFVTLRRRPSCDLRCPVEILLPVEAAASLIASTLTGNQTRIPRMVPYFAVQWV
jgi:hypothetical protein